MCTNWRGNRLGCTYDNEKGLSVEVKTHNQIIELLDEIKSIEKIVHQFDVPETIPFEPDFALKNVEQPTEIIEEYATEQHLPITSEIICRGKIEEDITPTKWHKLLSKKILSKTSISKILSNLEAENSVGLEVPLRLNRSPSKIIILLTRKLIKMFKKKLQIFLITRIFRLE